MVTKKIISSLPIKSRTKKSKNPFNKKLSIKLTSWDHVCGDGCCHTYGVDMISYLVVMVKVVNN